MFPRYGANDFVQGKRSGRDVESGGHWTGRGRSQDFKQARCYQTAAQEKKEEKYCDFQWIEPSTFPGGTTPIDCFEFLGLDVAGTNQVSAIDSPRLPLYTDR